MIYDSILDTIGRTPIVKLGRIAPAHVHLYAKVEFFNPGGSVKDRLALLRIIKENEDKSIKNINIFRRRRGSPRR